MTESLSSWLLQGSSASHIAIERGPDQILYKNVLPLVCAVKDALRAAGVETRQCVALRDFDFVHWPLVALAVIDGDWIYYPAPRHGHIRVEDVQFDFVAPRYSLTRVDRGNVSQMCIGEIVLDVDGSSTLRLAIEENSGFVHRPDVSPDVAYIVATSGSTGKPKVIAGSRKGLQHFIDWQSRLLAPGNNLRFSHLTSPTFDPVYREVLVPFRCGATQVHREESEDPASAQALVDWLERWKISVLHCVPTLLRVLCRECRRTGSLLPSLRWVFSAGDHLRRLDVVEFRALVSDRTRLFNLYGPSETTLAKFVHEVSAGEADDKSDVVPVGAPIPGATAIILDEAKGVCLTGEVGEIYIRTEFASHGYWGDPKRTAERFVPNPFAPGSAVKLFRTGDLGRVRADGRFEVLGRTDSSIKVHGRWVDLAAVEALLARELAPYACCVVECSRSSGSSSPDIVCFHNSPTVPAAGLDRNFLLRHLPPHAIPMRWLRLEELPVTAHGKYDRQRLIALAHQTPLAIAEEPESELEATLLRIWRSSLPESSEWVGVNVDFAAAGGHSIDAVRLVTRIRTELGVELSLRALTLAGTVSRLVPHLLAAAAKNAFGGLSLPFTPPPHEGQSEFQYFSERLHEDRRAADTYWYAMAERLETTPRFYANPQRTEAILSDAQRRFLALERRHPGNRSLTHVAASWIPGSLDGAALRAAVDAVVTRHACLRTSIQGTVQMLHASAETTIEIHESLDFDPESVEVRAGIEVARPLDLQMAPLLRVTAYTTPEKFLLVVSGHVIVSDGLSKAIWFRDLSKAYGALVQHEEISLGREDNTFADFAEWCARSGRGEASNGYWRSALAGAPWRMALPYDRPPTGAINERGDTLSARLDNAAYASVGAAALRFHVPRSVVILCHLVDALAVWSGLRALLVALPHLNRPDVRWLEVTGCFTESVLLHFDVSRSRTFGERVAYVASVVYDALEHSDASFERIADFVGLEDDRYDPNVVPIMYAPQPDYASELNLGRSGAEEVRLEQNTAIFNLHVFVHETDRTTKVEFNYSTAVFDRSTIVGLLQEFLNQLALCATSDGVRP